MPIYEYQCEKCKYKFEQLQKVTDKILHICPKCKKPSLVKLVSNTSFQLKGTGWYVTDFRDKKDKKDSDKKPKSDNSQGSKKKDNKSAVKTKKTSNS